MDEYYSAIRRLPPFLRDALAQLSPVVAASVHEIRLRSGRPVVFSTANGPLLAQNLIPKAADALGPISQERLQECFYALCERSVHSYERQLAEGFFTLPGGHRVGVAGLFHYTEDRLKGFQAVTSLNLRVARAIFLPLPQELTDYLHNGFRGMMVVGPPGSGKTTLLRSIIRAISDQGRKVAVVDERFELWPCGPGGFAQPVPLHCDVLSGCGKAFGILTALRSLGPQVIACDELGGQDEFRALEQGRKAGVDFLCSVHAEHLEDLLLRLNKSRMELARDFSCCVFLHSVARAGSIREVVWL